MRFLAVAQRIHVGIAAGKQETIEIRDYGVDIVCVRNQADVHRSTTGSFDSLAVIAPKIETIRCVFNAHRDADAWSCLYHSVRNNSSTAIITYVLKTASLERQKASLTYIETSFYSLVKETCKRKKIGFVARQCCSSGKALTLRLRATGR